MDKNEIINIALQNRMRITDQTKAVIDDTVGVFFCLTDKGMFTFDGVLIDYDLIISITYNQHTSSFFVDYSKDGNITSIVIQPRKSISIEPILLSKLIPIIIPGIDKLAYFDIMRSRGMFNGSLWEKDNVFKPISDWDFERVFAMVTRAYDEWGFKKKISERLCQMGLDLFMSDHQRNLWLEWVKSIKWDGNKRLDSFFKDCIGASAPVLQNLGKEDMYISSVTRAFFYGAIQRAMEESVMEVIPVLISTKQGIGKTSLVRYIAGPNKDWYKSIGSSIDNEKEFWENVNGGKIIELSEAEALKTTRVNQLKSFISKSSDTFREAYARYSQTHDRHWVMIATSNEQKMFIDKTGNRRFFPLICDAAKSTFKFFDEFKIGNFDYVGQVWAEAYNDFVEDPERVREIYCQSDIVECAKLMQESSTYIDDRYNAIDEYLDDSENGYVLQGSRITRAEIISKIFGENPSKPEKETTYTITKWAECTKKWKFIASTTYKGKSARNVFERKADFLSISEKYTDNELASKYYQFAKDRGLIGEMCNAQIDDFISYLNLPINYKDSIVHVLVKENIIWDNKGVWFKF